VTSRKSIKKIKKDDAEAHMRQVVSGYGANLTEITGEPVHLAGQLQTGQECFRCWISRSFFVQAFQEPRSTIRLTVNRCQSGFGKGRLFADGITWDELMDIKTQCGYGDRFAVEIYPEEKHAVNVSNMRHLWILSEPLLIGWQKDGTNRYDDEPAE
jgi:hypothetical protein